jgi:hypothetical protein
MVTPGARGTRGSVLRANEQAISVLAEHRPPDFASGSSPSLRTVLFHHCPALHFPGPLPLRHPHYQRGPGLSG